MVFIRQIKRDARKILIVADYPGWAFDHHAKDMMALPANHLVFELKYIDQVTGKDVDQYDLIYAMSVTIANRLHQQGIPLKKIAAGISSMRQFQRYLTNENTFKKEFITFFNNLRAVNTASDEFVNRFNHYRPIYKTRVGIDENLFTPPKRKVYPLTFTAGWVGRIDDSAHRKLKGYDLVLSAIEGLDVNLEIRTFTQHYVPREKMVEFYQRLHCFICSSESEHIPLPVLEAAACGVPIISTNVGIVPEMIRPYENGLIIQRNPIAIREALQYLMARPRKQKLMGRSIRNTILEQWTWSVCWKEWEEFFMTI